MTALPPAPLVREIRLASPFLALSALADRPHSFLLHSSLPDDRSRWSYFGAEPFAVFGPGEYDGAIGLWRGARAAAAVPHEGAPPFTGGLVGCWSYDFGRRLERLPAIARDDVGWPDVWLAAYDVIGAFEHATGRAWLIADPSAPVARARSSAKLEAWCERLSTPDLRGFENDTFRMSSAPRVATSTFSPDAYRLAVERVREHPRRSPSVCS